MTVRARARLVKKISAARQCILPARHNRRDKQQSRGSHFVPSGSANTISVDPPRNVAASGHKFGIALEAIDPQPVGVAMYCRPFTMYVTADPRCPLPV
jgi:hypothetical protein